MKAAVGLQPYARLDVTKAIEAQGFTQSPNQGGDHRFPVLVISCSWRNPRAAVPSAMNNLF